MLFFLAALLVADLTQSHCADYLTKIVVMGKSSAKTKVTEIMTPQSKMMTVPPTHSVINVMELMMKHGFRHVPVVMPLHAFKHT